MISKGASIRHCGPKEGYLTVTGHSSRSHNFGTNQKLKDTNTIPSVIFLALNVTNFKQIHNHLIRNMCICRDPIKSSIEKRIKSCSLVREPICNKTKTFGERWHKINVWSDVEEGEGVGCKICKNLTIPYIRDLSRQLKSP